MLKLNLKRVYRGEKYTIGKLYINDIYFCDTLEDKDRFLSENMLEKEIEKAKIYGETAIPYGTYDITMSVKSNKYSNYTKYKWAKPYDAYLPRLLNVKGFDGILIHPGNTEQDTYGCILVGNNNEKGKITSSQKTFNKLMDEYLVPNKNNKIIITIESNC